MALQLTTRKNYVKATTEYSSFVLNGSYTPPGQSKQSLRGLRAANGGDISQLGLSRLSLKHEYHQVIPQTSIAYVQPHTFDLELPKAVAMRITLTNDSVAFWDSGQIKSAQTTLLPKDDLTAAELEALVFESLNDASAAVPIYVSRIAAFINNNCEGNNALRNVILAASENVGQSDPDARTVAAGKTNEQVAVIDSDGVASLDVEQLTTLANEVGKNDADLVEAMSVMLAMAYAKIAPKLAIGLEPCASAIERARVERTLSVEEDVVKDLINYTGYLQSCVEDGTIESVVKVEAVFVDGLRSDRIHDLVAGDWSMEEVAAAGTLTSAAAGAGGANIQGGFGDTAVQAAVRTKLAGAVADTNGDWIAVVSGGEVDGQDETPYSSVGTWVAIDNLHPLYLLTLGKYAMAAVETRIISVSQMSPVAVADFAATRMTTQNHELYGASREVSSYAGTIWGSLPLNFARVLYDAVTEDVIGKLHHATAAISFRKSAHHSSANNVGNTFVRILESLDVPVDIGDVPERLAAGTHFGSHTADQRAVNIFFYALAQNSQLSFAIGRRISPHGPGTVSMYLLAQVVDQLENIKFFEFLQRTDILMQFKSLYQMYSKTAHLEVPYAQFFYGSSKAESVALKQSIAPMYAYAAAISSAMPLSTFADSMALRRDSGAAAANSITAVLEVESFVRAYKVFLRSLISNQLKAKAIAAGGVELLDDGAS